jgi:hypothetical protein
MRPRSCLVAALLTAALLGVQCEDSAARLRADNRAGLERAASDLQRIVALPALPGPEGAETRRGELQRLLQTVQGIRGAADLDASSAMLVAVIQREIALTSLGEAADAEIDLARQRHVMRTMLGEARRLAALAHGRASADLASVQQSVAAARGEAERQLGAHRQDATDLQAPISELRDANTADQAEIDRLLAQADALRREAAGLSPAAGFARFQDAVAIEREADQYGQRLNHREIDLDLELLPELRLAEARSAAASSMAKTADATSAALSEFQQALANDAATTRDAARAYGGELMDRLQAAHEQLDALQRTYDAAQSALETGLAAAQKGTGGSRGAETDSARVTASRLALALGQAAMSRARGLSDHAALLERLAEAGDVLPSGADVAAKLESVRAAMDQAAHKAAESLQRANELIGQVSERDVRKGLTSAPAALQSLVSGVEPAAPELAIPMPGGDAPRAAAGSSRGAGAASHQELLDQWFQAAGQPAVLDLLHSTTPAGRACIQGLRRLNRAAAPLNKALEEKFGSQAAQAAALLGSAVPSAGNATLASESATRAVYEFAQAPGVPRSRLPMAKVGDGWFVDADALAQEMGEAMAGLQKAAEVLERDGDDLAARVRKGELPTVQAVALELARRVAAQLLPQGAPPASPP